MITGSQISTSLDIEPVRTAHLNRLGLFLRLEPRTKSQIAVKERERRDRGSGVANLKSCSASEQRNVLLLSSISLYDHIRDDKALALGAKLIRPWIAFQLRHVFGKKIHRAGINCV